MIEVKVPIEILDSITEQLPPVARFKDPERESLDNLVFWVPGGIRIVVCGEIGIMLDSDSSVSGSNPDRPASLCEEA